MYVPANRGPLEIKPDGRLYANDTGNKDAHLAIDNQVHDSVSKMFLNNPSGSTQSPPTINRTPAPSKNGPTSSPFGLNVANFIATDGKANPPPTNGMPTPSSNVSSANPFGLNVNNFLANDGNASPGSSGNGAPSSTDKTSGPFGVNIAAYLNDPAMTDPLASAGYKPSSDDTSAYFTPGKQNPMYQQAFQHWMQTNPDKAKAFEKNIDEGNAGAKGRNKQVVNDLQMAINRGEISKQDASYLIGLGPASTWFHFDSAGKNGTSAGAYALYNATGGALGGDSSNPKAAGEKFDWSNILSLGGALPNPISDALSPYK